MSYVFAFIIGGIICVIGQVLMDATKLTPAHVLVLFVTSGVILTALGLYQPIVNFGGAGATIPLPGFGYTLAKGVLKAVNEDGFIGIFTGGVRAASGGISAAVVFGYLMAVLFNPKTKT